MQPEGILRVSVFFGDVGSKVSPGLAYHPQSLLRTTVMCTPTTTHFTTSTIIRSIY